MKGLGLSISVKGGPVAPVLPAFVIVDSANTTVTDQGGGTTRIDRTTGDGAFDAAAHGTTALTGDFIIRLTPQSTGRTIAGVDTNPTQDTGYSNIGYACFFNVNSVSSARNADIGVDFSGIAFAPGDNWFIKRSGSTLVIGNGGTDGVTGFTQQASYTEAGTLYFDSCLYDATSLIDVTRLS